MFFLWFQAPKQFWVSAFGLSISQPEGYESILGRVTSMYTKLLWTLDPSYATLD